MNQDDLLKIENQLCFPLYTASRKVISSYTPYLKPLDLTYTQYITLLVLWEKQQATVGELCKTLHLDNGTLTPLLKKLQTRGYIIRERDYDDERIVHVRLTDDGIKLKQKVSDIPSKVANCLHLSPDEAVILYTILYKIIETV